MEFVEIAKQLFIKIKLEIAIAEHTDDGGA